MQDILPSLVCTTFYHNYIDPHKAESLDGIPACALKELAFDLAPILTHLYQQSLNTSTLPEEWKLAFITPVFKKGKRSHPLNYRPISLTSIVCKIFEHIVDNQITNHLETNTAYYIYIYVVINLDLELVIHVNLNYYLPLMTLLML